MKNLFPSMVCVALLITGCANIHPVVAEPDRVEVNSVAAAIGRTLTANLGDSMVVEGRIVFYNAMTAVRDFQPPPQFGAPPYPEIKAGMVLAPYGRLDNGDMLYTHKKFILEKDAIRYCIAVNSRNEAYGDAACVLGLVRTWEEKPSGLLEVRRVYKTGSFQRELVYNGRSHDSIKILYREFNHDMIRPVFTQELNYDLSASREIGFKGLRLEILDADNTAIKFIVRSSFDKQPGGKPANTRPGKGAKEDLPL